MKRPSFRPTSCSASFNSFTISSAGMPISKLSRSDSNLSPELRSDADPNLTGWLAVDTDVHAER